MTAPITKKYLRLLTYISGFFLTVSASFPSYFNAEFLGRFVGASRVGLIFAGASLLTIVGISLVPELIRKLGLLKTLTILTGVNVLLVIPILTSRTAAVIVGFFIIYYSLGFVIRFVLDVYLEKISDDRIIGDIRGIFLTFANLAWLVSPFLAGSLIGSQGFGTIYLISALALLPVIYLAAFQLHEGEHHRQVKDQRLSQALAKLWRERHGRMKNIYRILWTDFLLNFFYAVMVVYTALYLTTEFGFSTIAVGTIFTIMLLPFVFFEYFFGWLADRWWGEKEILVGGFLLAGGATILVGFLHTNAIWPWALLLFLTRLGACAIEIMKETYLFKKIGPNDEEIVGLSRNLQPFSYIIGPLFGSIFLSFFHFSYIFIALGIIMLLGIIPSLAIKDTK